MRRRLVAVWVLFIGTALSAVSTLPAAEKPSLTCPATIEMTGTEFSYTSGVTPVLRTKGPKLVYLPRGKYLGYHVERVPEAASPQLLAREAIVTASTNSLEYPSLRYEFGNPQLVAIRWRDVGIPESGKEDSFIVPSGRYRFSLAFSLADASKSRRRSVDLCVVYSEPFRVAHESGYTTFH